MTLKEDILKLVQINNRVCPMPQKWNELWSLIERNNAGQKPPTPLILGAWSYTSDIEKANRLIEHIEWAEKQGQLNEIYQYLNGLSADDWHLSID